MKIRHALKSLTLRAFVESFGVDMMVHIVRMILPNYDIHARTGFPFHIPIPNRDAAEQIITDVINADLLAEFIALLIKVNNVGYMGRKYQVHSLRELLQEMYNDGLVYDKVNEAFVEDATFRKTSNWGVLKSGNEYLLSFLRVDIAGNTELVRTFPKALIEKCYADLREMVQASIDRRNGRVWNWEGDGGLVAFYFSDKYFLSVLAGVELVHLLFLYNLNRCPLGKPLQVRLAIHGGTSQFANDMEEIQKNDLVKKVKEAESRFTKPNTLTITENIFVALPTILAARFKKTFIDQGMTYYRYEIEVEQ